MQLKKIIFSKKSFCTFGPCYSDINSISMIKVKNTVRHTSNFRVRVKKDNKIKKMKNNKNKKEKQK